MNQILVDGARALSFTVVWHTRQTKRNDSLELRVCLLGVKTTVFTWYVHISNCYLGRCCSKLGSFGVYAADTKFDHYHTFRRAILLRHLANQSCYELRNSSTFDLRVAWRVNPCNANNLLCNH